MKSCVWLCALMFVLGCAQVSEQTPFPSHVKRAKQSALVPSQPVPAQSKTDAAESPQVPVSAYLDSIQQCDQKIAQVETLPRSDSIDISGALTATLATYTQAISEVKQSSPPPDAMRLKVEYLHFLNACGMKVQAWIDYQKEQSQLSDATQFPQINQTDAIDASLVNKEIEIQCQLSGHSVFTIAPHFRYAPELIR